MIMAAEAVRKAGVQLKGDLIVCPVVGETNELGYNQGTEHLLKQGVLADAAIVPEPYVPPDRINTVTCGAAGVIIHTMGSVGSIHEGILDDEASDMGGQSQIDSFKKMAVVLEAIEQMEMTHEPWSKFPGAPGVSCGTIIAGRGRDHDPRSSYFSADFCSALVNFALVPGQTPATVTQDVEGLLKGLAEADPELRYEIEPIEGWMPPIDAPVDMPVIEAIKRSYKRVAGDEIKEVGAPSLMPSDHTILFAAGIDAICYGPTGGWIHEPGERHYQYINIDQMVLATKVIAATAVDFCSRPK
jgi:acetylornithine deacetylase